MYILINTNSNKVAHIREKKPISYSNNLLLAEVKSLPEKYDYLIAENIREETETWTAIKEEYDANGEIVTSEVEQSRTYTTCDLVAKFNPQPTSEHLEKLKQVRYEKLVERFIRQKYSLSNELAILRQASIKLEEFAEYNAYAEECKAKAKTVIYGF